MKKLTKSGRISFGKFDVFINLLRKTLHSSSNKKKNSSSHVNIQNKDSSKLNKINEITQGKKDIVCSRMPPRNS